MFKNFSLMTWIFMGGMALGIIIFSSAGSYAQTGFRQGEDILYFDLSPEQLLSAEVISASKRLEKISEIPAAVYVITQDDIRRSGARNLPEALRMAPGVHVARSDANSWAVSIRGLNNVLANKLLVMLDGRTIYNPLFAGTYWDAHNLMLEDIDRIEVIRGPGGALWGANAVNGVINIISKKAAATQGNLVTVASGTQQYTDASVRHGGKFGGDDFYRIYAKHSRHGPFRTPAGDNAQDEWQNIRSGFRADWSNNFTLQGDMYKSFSEQLNSLPAFTAPFALIEKETMESRGANILGRWRNRIAGIGDLELTSYINYFARDQILLNDKRWVFEFDGQLNLPRHDRHELIVGATYRFLSDDLQGADNVSFTPKSRNDHVFSAFIQDQITLAPETWFLTLGSKVEHNDYSGFEVQPNARLLWHPVENQTVWAAVSRAVRTPSRLEHDVNFSLGVFAPGALLPGLTEAVWRPNPELDSENLTAYELGYRNQITSSLLVDVAAFYNYYDDLAVFGFPPLEAGVNPPRTILPVMTVNGMTGETYGFEVVSDWVVTTDWTLKVRYSLLDVQLHLHENRGFDLETEEGQSPHHQIYLGSSWDINERWSLETAMNYYDQLPTYNIDDYIRLDANLEYRFDENLRFNLIGQNLLDDAHREFLAPDSLNAAEIERTIFGKVTWEF